MREAYIKQIEVTDSDGDVVAILKHDVDDMYLLHPKKGAYMNGDDMRFIASVLDKLEPNSSFDYSGGLVCQEVSS